MMTRLCLLASVLAAVALLAPVKAQCGGGNCKQVSLPGPGGKTASCTTPPAKATGSRFAAGDFKYTCVGDAGKSCASSANSVKAGDPQYACCSCYLYAKHSYPAGQAGKTFVTNKDINTNPHVLLMPSAPCTGVEVHNLFGCPREAIWDEGRDLLKKAHKSSGWGMAINPVSRRGQHQMHVHLAEVHDSLKSAIVKAHMKNDQYIKCKNRQTNDCDSDSSGSKDKNIMVQFVKATDPSQAAPFAKAYTSDQLVRYASTLVVHLPGAYDMWAIVTNPNGPAECFFKSTTGNC